jgi:uncharacterized protein YndB with AHSA1/START domain
MPEPAWLQDATVRVDQSGFDLGAADIDGEHQLGEFRVFWPGAGINIEWHRASLGHGGYRGSMVTLPESAEPRARLSIVAERVVPYSAVIVWDALLDPVLADGWLGQIETEALPEGRYRVVWPGRPPHPADWFGRITRLVPGRRLALFFDPQTEVTFDLVSEADTSVRLRVRHRSYLSRSEALAVDEFWRRRLGYLAELLSGRPVDWRDASSG